MSLFNSMLFPPEGPPHIGIPLSELREMLDLVEATPEIHDKRIMGVRVRNNGMVLVKPGEQPGARSGGGYLLLEKTSVGWRVAEWTQ